MSTLASIKVLEEISVILQICLLTLQIWQVFSMKYGEAISHRIDINVDRVKRIVSSQQPPI